MTIRLIRPPVTARRFVRGEPKARIVVVRTGQPGPIGPAGATGASGGGASYGEVILPAPTGVTATDNAALAAGITAAGSTKRIVALPGVYQISGHHIIPNGVDLVGQGGGSTSTAGRTTFKCMASGAQIEIQGGGGVTGYFEIDGNSTATTPFFRNGGLGANAREIHNIVVHHNAVSGTHSNDLALFYGAQNDYYELCGFGYADRDARVFDQGFGGVTFNRCEITGTIGRYWDRYDNQIAGGVSPVPFNIVHMGTTNEEGSTSGVSVSHVKMIAGSDITYDKAWFYSANALTGPSIDVGTGCILNLVTPSFQSKPNGAPTAGTQAIKVSGTGRVTIVGRAQYLNFDSAINIDGVAAHVYDNTPPEFYNCNAKFTGTSGATSAQWANESNGLRTNLGAASDLVELTLNTARTAIMSSRIADGSILEYPQSGFPGARSKFGPKAAGVWGATTGTSVATLAVGIGSTASRPAAAAGLAGALWRNTDTGLIDHCDGTTWTSTTPHMLPSYAPGGLKYLYDPATNFYNRKASNCRKIDAGLERASGAGNAVFIVASDSSGAGCNQAIASPFTFDRRNSWPASMAKHFARKGAPVGGTGLIRCVDGPAASDDRWSSSGTVGNSSAFVTLNANTANITLTLTAADFPSIATYTLASIWYRDDGTGTWTASVNGASSGVGFATVTNTNTGAWLKLVVPGVAIVAGSTVKITRTSGATNQPFAGANCWTPNAGVIMHNLSQSGATASGTGFAAWADTSSTGLGGVYKDLAGHPVSVTDAVFNGTTTVTSATAGFTNAMIGQPLAHAASVVPFPDGTYIASINSPTSAVMSNAATVSSSGQILIIGREPDGVFISLGGNDLPAASNATVTAAYTTIRGIWPSSDAVYFAEYQKNDALITAAAWESFVAALWTLADSADLPLFDWRARLGNYATALANGRMGDNAAHLLVGAYIGAGRRVATALMP